MAETLTEDERNLLRELCGSATVETERNRGLVRSLAARGLLERYASPVRYVSLVHLTQWTTSESGRAALVEAAVAERLAALDPFLAGMRGPFHVDTAVVALIGIVRDQERRIAELELKAYYFRDRAGAKPAAAEEL